MQIWYILSNEVVHCRYGNYIWKIVPLTWRPWQLQCIKREFPVIFGDVTLDYPPPIFRDRTIDLKCWNEDINSYLLSRLASTSNKYLRPSIKCPWGCSEFLHKTGNISYDIIIQRILQKCALKLMRPDADKCLNKVCYLM